MIDFTMHGAVAGILNTAQTITQLVALGVDFLALLIIAAAALRAFILLLPVWQSQHRYQDIQAVRFYLGSALVLALEFLIGADILRSSITPSWTIIGQLTAIVLLRTLLDFLLSHELHDIASVPADESSEQ